MRKLDLSDAFSVARMIKTGDLKEPIRKAYEESLQYKNSDNKEEKDKGREKLGIDIVFALIEGAANSGFEEEFYQFAGSIFEMKAEDVKHLGFTELMDKIKELAKENDLANFSNLVANLT